VPAGTYRFALTAPGVGMFASTAVIAKVQSDSTRLDFGPAPGTSSVTVHITPQRGYALWIVRGTVSGLGNPPLDLLKSDYAQLVYQPMDEKVTFNGLAPGHYSLVWSSFHAESSAGPTVEPIDVPSQPEVSLVR
jgi:hypothetical protein